MITSAMSEDEVNNLMEGEEQGEEISGWADSMLKILKSTKPKNKKNLMLSRARKDYEVNKTQNLKKQINGKKKDEGFEIARDKKPEKEEESVNEKEVDDDNKKADKKTPDSDTLSLKQQRKLELRQRKLERAWENLNRLTTETTDKEMERDLLKIATKGVVQLFNAVATQQKSLKTKLRASGTSEFKKDKVMSESKDLFNKAMSKSKIIGTEDDDDNDVEIKKEDLSDSDEEASSTTRNVKLGKRKANSEGIDNEPTSSKKPVWAALQDDFMLDAKLKDWDQDSDSD